MSNPNAITTVSQSLSVWTEEQIDLIKSHLFAAKREVTNSELALYGQICNQLQLDPFSRHIYAIERKGTITYQISIDGLRAIAERSGQYAGSDEPLFDEGLSQFECEQQGRKSPTVAKVIVYKIVQGQKCAFAGVAGFREYNQKSPNWQQMPFNQLAKCAESQALRKAFPNLVSLEQSVKSQVAPPDTSWHYKGAKWAEKQGLPSNEVEYFLEVATSKEQFFQLCQQQIENNRQIAQELGLDVTQTI